MLSEGHVEFLIVLMSICVVLYVILQIGLTLIDHYFRKKAQHYRGVVEDFKTKGASNGNQEE